jgi:hypothetical protein
MWGEEGGARQRESERGAFGCADADAEVDSPSDVFIRPARPPMEDLPKPPTPSPQDTEVVPVVQPPKDPLVKTFEAYQSVAETVGGVPTFNWFDNLLQIAIIIVGVPIAILIGYLISGPGGAAFGCLLGLIVSAFLGGAVVMVLGLVRAAKRTRR